MLFSRCLRLLFSVLAVFVLFSNHVSGEEIKAGKSRTIRLPGDESPHSDPTEWWYYTGILHTGDAETYGFEMVTFQNLVQGKAYYMTHFAITDQKKGCFRFGTKRSAMDQRNKGPGFTLNVGGWRMSGHAGKDRLFADMNGYAIDIRLTAQKPMILQFGTGQMTVGSDNPFYYYSYTQMAAVGELTVDGVEKPVTGQAWMDHQWGDMGHDFAGWDWVSLRLDDFTEVMFFIVRRGKENGFIGGTFVEKDGAVRGLKKGEFNFTSLGRWKSPRSEADYPHGWSIRIPFLYLDVKVVPVMADQEVVDGSLIYWEGLCDVIGKRQGKPIGGHAYVELTGYQNRRGPGIETSTKQKHTDN